jgi:Ca-activated chloride channel family protein
VIDGRTGNETVRATALRARFFACGETAPPASPALLRLWRNRPVVISCALLLLAYPGLVFGSGWSEFWLTADQRGGRLFAQERYLEAAEVFESQERRGVAFFRGGDFESAATVFGRISSAEAAYNRGNALVMLGRYKEAIQSYEDALNARPGWIEAEENLVVAVARKERMAPPESDEGGTGGQLEADEIVFDDSGRVNKSGTEVVTEGGEEMSDDEMRAVWLRRVQNDPAEFLRTRFAYQLYRDEEGEAEDE